MIKLAEWALCAPYVFRLAYGERYRQSLGEDDQSLTQDFQCYLPNIKLATPAEVLRSYSFELTSDELQARLRNIAPWDWSSVVSSVAVIFTTTVIQYNTL